VEADGITVRLRVQPKARRPGFGGVVVGGDGARLKLAVTAPPADGAANRAVCVALAEALGVAPSAVAVAQGAGAREKTLRVAGDPVALGARLQALA